MKKLILLLFVLPILGVANNKKPVQTKVTQATVYLEGATITRTGKLQLLTGENTFVFGNLSPDIEENSIQLSGLGNASVRTIVSSISYVDKKDTSAEFDAIANEINALNVLASRINNTITGYNEELKILSKNQIIHGDQKNISIERVQEITTYYRNRVTQVNNSLYDQNLKLDSLNKRKLDLYGQQSQLNDNKKERRGEITIIIDASTPADINLELRYNVIAAGWYPTYDIRAKSTTDPIDIMYKANVYQQTGTDWEDVKLTLSTGDPNTNNTKPFMAPKYLNFTSRANTNTTPVQSTAFKYNPTIRTVTGVVVDETGLPLPEVNVVEQGTTNGTQTDFDGRYSISIQGARNLNFSYVGYDSKIMPIYSSTIDVALNPGAELQEVVVMARGMAREKRAYGYASSSVQSSDISGVLNGRAAGISAQAGTSGSATNVVIRGYNSITGADQALFVVDGVPFDSSDFSGSYRDGNSGSSRYLDLDPENIESVNVLKGLAAATLYGTAGHNGVIVITTKSGDGLTAVGNTKFAGLTTTRFEIKETHSIGSNAKITAIELDKFSLAATFEYYAAPALNENVFLTATIKNWEAFDLLQGEANIYFDGSYAGKTNISPRATTDGLQLSLGQDPSVVIQRKEKENFKSRSFLGANRVIDRQFEIQVKNNKTTAITLKIEDRIPVSQNKEIKVDDLLLGGGLLDEQTGLLTWEVNLEPQEQNTKTFGFTVKYPKFKRINL